MKVAVTHLKAAWPEGVTVGSVVEIEGDAVPVWAAGKCVPAADDAQATHSLASAHDQQPAPAQRPDALAAAEAQAAAERAAMTAKRGQGKTARAEAT